MLRGALFDWDGVVIDSSRQHEMSWERLAAEEGLELPEGHFRRGFGMKNAYIIPNILGWTEEPGEVGRLGARKEALYREIVREEGLEPLEGVRELLEAFREAGVRCAVGSSTPRVNIDTILPVLGLEAFFSAVVTAEDVGHGKPDPEVFLRSAAMLELPAEDCVVFEDAFVGIEAGLRSGAKVVAVATTHGLDEIEGKAHRAVRRLSELALEEIQGLWG